MRTRAVLVGLAPTARARRVGAALDRRRGRRASTSGTRQRDHLHAVAVARRACAADLVVGRQRAGEHEPDAALLEHVRGAVAHAGLQAGVGDLA